MSAGATAAGTRSWLATRRISPRLLRGSTLLLLIAALLASTLLVGGSAAGSTRRAPIVHVSR